MAAETKNNQGWMVAFLVCVMVGGLWATISSSREKAAAARKEREAAAAAAAAKAKATALDPTKPLFAKGDFPVSERRDLVEKYIKYARQNDAQAIDLLLAENAGQLPQMHPGTAVHLMDTAIFSGLVKFRPHGDTAEYWAPQLELTNTPPAK